MYTPDMELPPFEEHPIILSEEEHERFKKLVGKGWAKRLSYCFHRWEWRTGRKESFLIVHDDAVDCQDIKNGRYCTKCRLIQFDWTEEEMKGHNATPWTQKDFIALGFTGGASDAKSD